MACAPAESAGCSPTSSPASPQRIKAAQTWLLGFGFGFGLGVRVRVGGADLLLGFGFGFGLGVRVWVRVND